jgi:hypothetical protein
MIDVGMDLSVLLRIHYLERYDESGVTWRYMTMEILDALSDDACAKPCRTSAA